MRVALAAQSGRAAVRRGGRVCVSDDESEEDENTKPQQRAGEGAFDGFDLRSEGALARLAKIREGGQALRGWT
eukprot:3407385-Pleurochrysis_carterae.AAC.1